MQLYRLLLTFSALVYAHPPLNPVAKSVAGLVEGKEGLITSAVKAGTNKILPLEHPPLEFMKHVKFKPGIPSKRVALTCTTIDCDDVSFYIRRSFDDIHISYEELQKYSPFSKELMDKYDLDFLDAMAVKRALDRYNDVAGSKRFEGEPPTQHIRPEVLASSLKHTGGDVPVKNEVEELYSFYASLKQAATRADHPSLPKDRLDEMSIRFIDRLGYMLDLKYKSGVPLTDRQERFLQFLLKENGYRSSHGRS